MCLLFRVFLFAFRLALTACATLLLPASAAEASITQLSVNAGEVRSIAAIHTNPSATAYAGTQGGGVYKTIDAGTTWSRLSGLPARYVWQVVVASGNANVVYAASTVGLWKSTDAGVTWSRLTNDVTRAVAIAPDNDSLILIGVPGAGIYRSTDAGATFAQTNTGLDSTEVRAIVMDTGNVAYVSLSGNMNGGTWGGVFKSTTGGSTWVNWNNPSGSAALTDRFVTSLAIGAGGTLLAGSKNPNTGDGKVYRQVGTGSWSNPSTEAAGYLFGVESLASDPNASTTLWAGSRALGLYLSTDNGLTWTRQLNAAANPELLSGVYAIGLFWGQAGRAVIGAQGLGLRMSLNATGAASSVSWSNVSGLMADRVRAITSHSTVAPSTFYLGLEGGGVWRSTNGGTNWGMVDAGISTAGIPGYLFTPAFLSASPATNSRVYAAVQGRGLFLFDGSVWSQVNESGLPAVNNSQGLLVWPNDDRVVFLSLFDTGQGVYRRNTAGAWSLVQPSSAVVGNAGMGRVVMPNPANPNLLFALMYDATAYLSSNGGLTWSPVTTVNPNPGQNAFTRIAFSDVSVNPTWPAIMVASTNQGIFRSTDGAGQTWTRVSVSGLQQTVLTGLAYSTNNVLWGIDRTGGFYCSRDNGTTWTTVATPVSAALTGIASISGLLYLSTDGAGLLRVTTDSCP